MLTGRVLEEAADRAQADIQRDEARFATGGVVEEDGGLLLCRGQGRLPVSPNTVMPTGPVDPDTLFERAARFFAEQRAGYTLHLRLGGVDDDLVAPARALGALHEIDAPAMVVHDRLAPGPALGDDVDVQRLVDGEGTAAYAAVVDDAYQSLGWPPGGAGAIFEPPAVLLQPNKCAFVAFVGGEPCAAASVSLHGDLGLVSWVGTTAAARGRGLARAVTVAATNAGFDLGAVSVWLAASNMGEPIYRRLGFEEFGRTRGFVLWPGL
jgi:hypothetical protein